MNACIGTACTPNCDWHSCQPGERRFQFCLHGSRLRLPLKSFEVAAIIGDRRPVAHRLLT
jgi:hypothetical protein